MRRIIPIIALLVAGCDGAPSPYIENGRKFYATPHGVDRICINGVTYIWFGASHGSIAVELDRDSKVIPCTGLK